MVSRGGSDNIDQRMMDLGLGLQSPDPLFGSSPVGDEFPRPLTPSDSSSHSPSPNVVRPVSSVRLGLRLLLLLLFFVPFGVAADNVSSSR